MMELESHAFIVKSTDSKVCANLTIRYYLPTNYPVLITLR